MFSRFLRISQRAQRDAMITPVSWRFYIYLYSIRRNYNCLSWKMTLVIGQSGFGSLGRPTSKAAQHQHYLSGSISFSVLIPTNKLESRPFLVYVDEYHEYLRMPLQTVTSSSKRSDFGPKLLPTSPITQQKFSKIMKFNRPTPSQHHDCIKERMVHPTQDPILT